ncbi:MULTISPECIES: hypothetical protein [Caproicibacterium]|uniref:Resolvase/invertase-type recombinase catalytic domain-containing protein n=1 Tax=Caproicibacterium argilliputei TaxID=3030016 RepID=A0AA97H100_9FIRM|nr:hypothetical protein [Caproicibacterium argilliputei]WOC31903.1 hypothetical protein PXC00_11995 [Caproicibacterium argilliputei]
MTYNPKVHIIPAKPARREKPVGIYCRVSTNVDVVEINRNLVSSSLQIIIHQFLSTNCAIKSREEINYLRYNFNQRGGGRHGLDKTA